MTSWKLKRTAQCEKCPWRVDVDPHDIPDGYCEIKHQALDETIAEPGALPVPGAPLRAMACHETDEAHCVGWVNHQLGVGNNIALRLRMMSCSNIDKLRLRGDTSHNGKRCVLALSFGFLYADQRAATADRRCSSPVPTCEAGARLAVLHRSFQHAALPHDHFGSMGRLPRS